MSNEEMTKLGSRLKETREYLNLSQEFVSKTTGIPRTAISAIEYGKRKVSSIELAKLAKLYNYPVSYFIGEQEEVEDTTLHNLYRAAGDLTESDKQELIRFAEFLKYSGNQNPATRNKRSG
jgi:transcriptional regulator with XRE-family HTH domain